MKKNKKTKTFGHLIPIPVILVLDVIAIALAGNADISMSDRGGEQLGHAAPGLTIIVGILMAVITVIVIVVSIIKTIKGIAAKKKAAETEW